MSKIARVQLPDGRVARMEVPDDATPEQIQSFAQKQFAAKPKKAPEPGGVLGWISNNVFSPVNEAIIGAPEGIYNAASAITDPLSKLVFGSDAVKQAQAQRRRAVDAVAGKLVSRPAPVARDIGRIGGSMAIPLPGGKLQQGGKWAQGAYRAMQGAVGGAAVRNVDQDPTGPAATGALANVVLPPLISKLAQTAPAKALGGAVSKVTAPAMNMLDNAAEAILPSVNRFLGRQHVPLQGMPPPAPAQTPFTTPEAVARAARFRELGIKPTSGMVTRDPAAYSFEQNASKLPGGESLGQQIMEARKAIGAKGKELIAAQGGFESAEQTGEQGIKFLVDKMDDLQQQTGALYRQAREAGQNVEMPIGPNFRGALDDPDWIDNADFDTMRASIVNRLKRIGVADKNGEIMDDAAMNLAQAEELRKFIGKLPGFEPAKRAARGKLITALDDDVVELVGDEPFKIARESAKARFTELEGLTGKLTGGKISPERVVPRIMGSGVSLKDVRRLRQSYHTGTPVQVKQGRVAWNGIKAQMIDDFLAGTVDEEGKVAAGTLASRWRTQSGKLKIALEPQEYRQLGNLVKASHDIVSLPPMHSVNTSNTAVMDRLFPQMKPKVKDGWIKFLAKNAAQHAAAAAIQFPGANIVLMAGKQTAATVGEVRAAKALARQIETAQSPEAAEAAFLELQRAAQSNAAAREMLDKLGAGIGGTAAAAAQ